MKRRPPPSPQRDLFGRPPDAPPDRTPVTVPLREVSGSSTDKALFLAPMPGGKGRAGFAPRSEVRRGEGDQAQFFTMPRWLAVERGWV